MQPTNSNKRSFEILDHLNPSEENPPKRRRVDSSLQPIRSDSPFGALPNEVIALLFQGGPIRDLLNFERVCWNHLRLTGGAWHYFRERKFFQLDWNICNGNHRSNYLLSKVVVDFVKGLPARLGFPLKEQTLQKFQWIGEQFPPVEALIQLVQLPKEEVLPKELESQLKQEEIIDLITDIYQFAKHLWQLRKGNSKAMHKVQQGEIQHFNLKLKPRVKQAIERNGTYLSSLTTHIFDRFFPYCLSEKSQIISPIRHLVIELAHEAFKKGDESGYETIRNSRLFIRHLAEDAPPHLLVEENFKIDILIDQFMHSIGQKSRFVFKEMGLNHSGLICDVVKVSFEFSSDYNFEKFKALWPHVKTYLNKIDLSIDKLEQVFKFHFEMQNWIEADHCLRRILEKQSLEELKETTESCGYLMAYAKVQVKLNQFEKADAFYTALLKKNAHSDHKKHKALKSEQRCWVLIDALGVKIKLGDFKEANCYIDELFRNLDGLFNQGEEHIYNSLMRLIAHIIQVKELLKVPSAELNWFKCIDRLLKVDVANRQEYLEVDQLLNTGSYKSEKYLFPKFFSIIAGNVKRVLEKWQEAEEFYEKGFSPQTVFTLHQKLNVGIVKYKLGKWREAEQILQSILTSPLPVIPLPKSVYTILMDLYCNKLNSLQEACRVYNLAVEHHLKAGLPIPPDDIIQWGINLQMKAGVPPDIIQLMHDNNG